MQKMPIQKGTVNWYDHRTKKGSILGADGNMYRIHEFVDLKESKVLLKGHEVTFRLVNSSVHPIIKWIHAR